MFINIQSTNITCESKRFQQSFIENKKQNQNNWSNNITLWNLDPNKDVKLFIDDCNVSDDCVK